MLVYLIGAMVAVWFAVTARASRGSVLVWALSGLASYFVTYFAWRLLFQKSLVENVGSLARFLVAGMVLGLFAAVVVLAALLGAAVERRITDGKLQAADPLPAPPDTTRRRRALAFGATFVLAAVSILLQALGIIHDEIVAGGMLFAGLAGALGGVLLRRPLRSLLLGILLGLAYSVCYGVGLFFIGKLNLTGGENAAGAFIGLPLMMMAPAAGAGLLFAVGARATESIVVWTRWLSGLDRMAAIDS
jgi:hypothetical protein